MSRKGREMRKRGNTSPIGEGKKVGTVSRGKFLNTNVGRGKAYSAF